MRLCKEKSNLFDPLLFLFLSFTRISTLNSEQSRFLEVFTMLILGKNKRHVDLCDPYISA